MGDKGMYTLLINQFKGPFLTPTTLYRMIRMEIKREYRLLLTHSQCQEYTDMEQELVLMD